MDENKSFDFQAFVVANAGREVSGFDYVHAVYKLQNLHSDFVLWFAKLCWPEFKSVDGRIYVAEIFNTNRYQGLLDAGKSSSEAQFWMNLLEITGLFDDISNEHAITMAELLAQSWSSKLSSEFGISTLPARVICDSETGEVFVTIGNAERGMLS